MYSKKVIEINEQCGRMLHPQRQRNEGVCDGGEERRGGEGPTLYLWPRLVQKAAEGETYYKQVNGTPPPFDVLVKGWHKTGGRFKHILASPRCQFVSVLVWQEEVMTKTQTKTITALTTTCDTRQCDTRPPAFTMYSPTKRFQMHSSKQAAPPALGSGTN